MEERSKLQKAVLISMAAMVVLFGVLMVAARFQKGVRMYVTALAITMSSL